MARISRIGICLRGWLGTNCEVDKLWDRPVRLGRTAAIRRTIHALQSRRGLLHWLAIRMAKEIANKKWSGGGLDFEPHFLHPDLKADSILADPQFTMIDLGSENLRPDPDWKFGARPKSNSEFAREQHSKGRRIRASVRTDVWAILAQFDEALDRCRQYLTDISWSNNEAEEILTRETGYARILVANKCKTGGRIEESGRAIRMERVGRPSAFFG